MLLANNISNSADVNIIQINNNEWSGIAIPYYMVANRDKNSSHKVWLPLK